MRQGKRTSIVRATTRAVLRVPHPLLESPYPCCAPSWPPPSSSCPLHSSSGPLPSSRILFLPTPTVTSRYPEPPKPINPVIAPYVQATFDDVPVGIVDTSYQAKGITFACVGTGCASPHAYAALANPLVTAVQNHVVSPFAGNIMPFFDDRSGAIQATFNKACTRVSVLVQVLASAEGYTPATART